MQNYSLEEMIERLGPGALERKRIMDSDLKYWNENRQAITGKYPDMFVAVYNGTAIDSDKDLRKLSDRLEGRQCLIQRTYFNDPEPKFILPVL